MDSNIKKVANSKPEKVLKSTDTKHPLGDAFRDDPASVKPLYM